MTSAKPLRQATQSASLSLDEIFEELKEQEPVWLSTTLSKRWLRLRSRSRSGNAPVRKKQSLDRESREGDDVDVMVAQKPMEMSMGHTGHMGHFDVTLPHLPDELQVSDYVAFLRSYDWAATALGPMSTWSEEVRKMVNMCLRDPRASGNRVLGPLPIYSDPSLTWVQHCGLALGDWASTMNNMPPSLERNTLAPLACLLMKHGPPRSATLSRCFSNEGR